MREARRRPQPSQETRAIAEHVPPRHRRFEHAHRVVTPVGSIDPRHAPRVGGRPTPGPLLVAAAIALAGITAVAALAAAASLGDLPGSSSPAAAALPGTSPSPLASERPVELPAPTPSDTRGPIGDIVVPGVSEAPGDMATLWDIRPTAPWLLTGYRWPIDHARITNGFGVGHPGSFVLDGRTYHDGLDIANFCGDRIVAAHDGTVLVANRHAEGFLGWVGDLTPFRDKLDRTNGWSGESITVVIDDGNGYRSVYAHLGLATVERGDHVRAGDQIGWEGASGHATGCHLHYALFNPLETRTVRLEAKIADRTLLPSRLIVRVDPLLVMPPPADADLSWGWGAR